MLSLLSQFQVYNTSYAQVKLHTGLTQTDGKDAPGRKEREAQMEAGVIYE